MNEKEAISEGLRIINPNCQKYICFDKLRRKEATVFLLHLAGFTYDNISLYYPVTKRTLKNWVKKGYEEYPRLKKL